MFRYNNTIDSDSDNHNDDTSSIDHSVDEILIHPDHYNNAGKFNSSQYNIVDTIIQHPFIERLLLKLDDLYKCREKIYIIPYKTSKYDNNDFFIEFYINHDFFSIELMSTNNNVCKMVDNLLENLPGRKKMVGNMKFNGHQYLFVQVRDNSGLNEKWVNEWDILGNKHYFGKKIQKNVIDFFTHNSTISDLILHKRICSKPISLYTQIDESYIPYINQNQSIQYCQRKNEPLIILNEYVENDNIRIVCFVEDCDFSTNNNELRLCDYIQIKRNKQVVWLFKNENKMVSYSIKNSDIY
tara:strand:+ start:1573 stop:2463 length:891 start_codon:yes stop_codon:yes gene_type:complete